MIPQVGRKTFTSHNSLVYAHRLRKRADAILTGSGTILADNPLFTVRHVADFKGKRRHLVIMDRRGRVANDYFKSAQQAGFEVWRATSLEQGLTRLGQAGAMEVLLEAGPSLLDHVLASKFWDEHVIINQANPEQQSDRISIRQRNGSKLTETGN